MAIVTFGYESAGLSAFNTPATTYIVGSTFTSGANAGTLDKLTFFLKRVGTPTGKRLRAAIYNGTTLVGSSGEILQTDVPTTTAAVDFTFSGETILASTNYTLVLMMEARLSASDVVSFYRDSSGGTSVDATLTYGSFPNPATWSAGTRNYSVYATYTEGGGGGISIPVVMHHLRQQGIS